MNKKYDIGFPAKFDFAWFEKKVSRNIFKNRSAGRV